MKRILILPFLILLSIASAVWAQTPVATTPGALNNVDNESSVITLTNTFQQVFAATIGRNSCTIQNNSSSNTMFVFFGPATPTTATSFQLKPGLFLNCETVGGVVPKTAVQITGTTSDAYYAVQW